MRDEESGSYTSRFAIPYSDASILNTVDVHLPHQKPDRLEGHWVLFIHGGAWRDPKQTSRDILPALEHLAGRHTGILGIASINYRLSPHPEHPAEPGSPDEAARSAVHPAHLHDVIAGISWLQRSYDFRANYILVGHSAGATLAFQAVMGIWHGNSEAADSHVPPEGIAGVCGIYDLSLLVKTHTEHHIYRDFVERAFGQDPSKWDAASPAVSGWFATSWPLAKAAVLAASQDDELVDFVQTKAMAERLHDQRPPALHWENVTLRGSHNEVVAGGAQLANAIVKCLSMVSKDEKTPR